MLTSAPMPSTKRRISARSDAGVEGAVDRADDVDARLLAFLARLALGNFLAAVLRPQPEHGAVGALPLILVDGARQEALDVGAFGRHAAADHLGDRAGDDDGGQVRIERLVRAAHRAFGARLAELFLGESGDDDRQLVRRQRVGVVQHRRDRQVLAADRTVDDDLQALDRREDVDRAPVATGAIMVEDEHQIISSALRFFASFSRRRLYSARNCRLSLRHVLPDAGRIAFADAGEERLHGVEARLAGERGVDDLGQRACAGRPHQRARRNQVGEIERRDRHLLWPSARRASCRWRDRA